MSRHQVADVLQFAADLKLCILGRCTSCHKASHMKQKAFDAGMTHGLVDGMVQCMMQTITCVVADLSLVPLAFCPLVVQWRP